jgi:hypothetical protein
MAFAIVLTFLSGMRGFFPFDQSIVFDGAYRVLSGQTVYRDFVTPMGPLVYWMQAAVFRAFGTSYESYVGFAALMNACAALLVWRIIRANNPQRLSVAFVASVITGACFYAPFGTPWFEQTASLFVLVMIWLLFRPGFTAQPTLSALLAGTCAGAAFLCKQNCGMLAAALGLVACSIRAIWTRDSFKRLILAFGAGVAALLIGFMCYIVLLSDARLFYKYFIAIPFSVGHDRLFGHPFSTAVAFLLGGDGNLVQQFCNASAILLALMALCARMGNRDSWVSSRGLWSSLGVSCIIYQNVLMASTNNDSVNGYPFIGLVVGILFREASEWGNAVNMHVSIQGEPTALWNRHRPRTAAACIAAMIAIGIAWKGVDVSISRQAHDVFAESDFNAQCHVPILRQLRWGTPTPVGARNLEARHIEELVEFLAREHSNFFVFKDFTIMYAMMGVAPPQPLLWFHHGLTYKMDYDRDLDRQIVDSLEQREVKIIVIETSYYTPDSLPHNAYGTPLLSEAPPELHEFPILERYIASRFSKVRDIGLFAIYTRQ